MIVSSDWLAEYVSLDMPVERLAERLTMAGLNLESIEEVAGDAAIDLEVTSNRPDCLGHIGIAREAGVLFDRSIRIPEARPAEGKTPVAKAASVRIECPDLCPAYTARVLRGVRVGPSPEWMRQRLAAVGMAAINNIVDATNYVLMECGQPLHAFDLDRLAGRRIVVRRARGGEKLQAIDHREYALSPEMCVIADAEKPVAIAGVMGGSDTEITSATTNLLIEVAAFQPLSVHHTARSLKLHSASSYRFERKVNDQQLDWASRRCCELILESGGGELLSGCVVAGEIPAWRPEAITLRTTRVRRVLGIDVPFADCRRILLALGLVEAGSDGDETLRLTPPDWRRDLTREIDLIEEIARIHGYDHIPEDRPIPIVAGTRSLPERIDERVRNLLTAAGFDEAITFSFINESTQALFDPQPGRPPLTIFPAAGDYGQILRRSLLPSLIACRSENARRGNLNAELFEVARVYLRPDAADASSQPRRVGLVSGRSFFELRGVLDALARSMCASAEVTVRPSPIPQFQAGRGAELLLNGAPWGWMGELDRAAAGVQEWKLREAATVAEIDLQPLVDAADLSPRAQPFSESPAVTRDLNFVLDEDVAWSQLATAVRSAAGPHLEAVRFVEQYRGQQLPAGKKSYVLSITYRAWDRTLTGEEVDAAQLNVVEACHREWDAVLR